MLLSGTGRGEAATTLLALARFGGQPAVVLGQQRVVGGMVGPAALREARRGMALAAGLRLPLVLVIDTAGPALTVEAEQGGLAGEIARCLAELVTLDTPTVSVLLGQGSGGPALAMVPADRVLAALHGWLAPLPPEGASAIVFRDIDHAPELAAAQGIRSADLLRNGIVDAIVPEHPDAADEPMAVHAAVVGHHRQRAARLRSMPDDERLPSAGALPADRACDHARTWITRRQLALERAGTHVRRGLRGSAAWHSGECGSSASFRRKLLVADLPARRRDRRRRARGGGGQRASRATAARALPDQAADQGRRSPRLRAGARTRRGRATGAR